MGVEARAPPRLETKLDLPERERVGEEEPFALGGHVSPLEHLQEVVGGVVLEEADGDEVVLAHVVNGELHAHDDARALGCGADALQWGIR